MGVTKRRIVRCDREVHSIDTWLFKRNWADAMVGQIRYEVEMLRIETVSATVGDWLDEWLLIDSLAADLFMTSSQVIGEAGYL